MNKFFIKEKNVEKGPLSYNELYDFIDYSKSYLIWYKGLDKWIPFEKSNIYTELVKGKEIGAKKKQIYQFLSKASIILFITLIILIALPYSSLTRVFFQKNLIDIYMQMIIPLIILLVLIKLFMWSIFSKNKIFIKKYKNPNEKYFYIIPVIFLTTQVLYFLITGFYSVTKINNTYSEIQIQNELDHNSILGKRGLINSKENKIIIPATYGDMTYYNNNISDSSLFIVKKYKQLFKTGVVNMQNNIIIPFETQSIDFLNENNFIISRGPIGKRKIGVVNSNNQIVVPFIYSQLFTFSNNFFIVNSGNEYENINLFVLDVNNIKISRNYIDLWIVEEGKFAVLFDMRHHTSGVHYIQGDLFDFDNRIIYHKVDEEIAQKIVEKKYFKNIQTSTF